MLGGFSSRLGTGWMNQNVTFQTVLEEDGKIGFSVTVVGYGCMLDVRMCQKRKSGRNTICVYFAHPCICRKIATVLEADKTGKAMLIMHNFILGIKFKVS